MAKNNKDKNKEKDKVQKAKDKKKDGAFNTVKKDIEGGKKLNSELGFDAPLSRLDTNIPEDQRSYIEALRSMSDPSSPAYVGARSGEEKEGLGFLEKLMKDAGVRSDDMSGFLGKLKGEVDTAGQRTADTSDVIARAKNQADVAGQRSAEMTETLALMKGGLAGLNAQENQAIREQAQREVDRKRQSAIEAAESAARMGGMRGGALNASKRAANRDAMAAQADMEQKNLISNIDIQDRRRSDYANTLGREEGAEFGRGNTALNTLGSFVGSAEDREAQRGQAARDAYGRTLGDTEGREFDQRYNAGSAYNERLGSLRDSEFDRTDRTMGRYGTSLKDRNDFFMEGAKTNLGQERTERAASITGATGLAGLVENERQRRKDKRKAKGDGRDRAGQTGANTPAYDPMGYYDEVKKIYQDSGAL